MTLQRTAGEKLELLIQPAIDFSELRTSLRDVERLNSWFGGTGAIVDEVQRLVLERDLARGIAVLDIGTGGADIPTLRDVVGQRLARARVVVCRVSGILPTPEPRSTDDLRRANSHLNAHPELLPKKMGSRT